MRRDGMVSSGACAYALLGFPMRVSIRRRQGDRPISIKPPVQVHSDQRNYVRPP